MSRRIIVTGHALQRVRERCGRGFDEAQVKGEIRAAAADGRIGCKPPREFADRSRRKKLKQRAGRYVWVEDHSRCYAVQEIRGNGSLGPPGEKLLIVTTVLVPHVAAAA